MILPWDFDVENAPRDGSKVVIATLGLKKVRWCVWNKIDKKWSGLLPGETPLAFLVISHPEKVQPQLPPGVVPAATLPPGVKKSVPIIPGMS